MARFDLFAIPGYFATMGMEYAYLQRRRSHDLAGGTRPGEPLGYERRDTLTSLSMGTLSLAVPLVAPRLLAPITPGKGRYGRHLIAVAATAGAMTCVADLVARRAKQAPTEAKSPTDVEAVASVTASRRWRRARLARKVARVTGPLSLATGTLAATTAWGHATRSSAMYERRIIRNLGDGPAAWTIALVGWDLLYYLNHRMWHATRFMWANHVMHHSSERYNLSTALRQATTDPLLFPVPYSLLSLIGVRPEMVASSRAINLIYQYWIHTEVIRSLGPFEEVANTPSHHRVHHGVNREYIDRNHGGILIIWDRIFGTFTREREPVVYGLTKNIHTYRLGKVNFHEYQDIIRDVANAENWRDRLSFTFRGPGWAYERHRAMALMAALVADG